MKKPWYLHATHTPCIKSLGRRYFGLHARMAALAWEVLRVLCLLQGFFLFSYVTGSHSFPKPLTPEEERCQLQAYAQGDKEAKNILIERNLRLVAHVVKKYGNKDTEDLISIGTIGLIKAIGSFKPEKGVKLATYAARCIDNAMGV